MADSPVFASTPRTTTAQTSTANASRNPAGAVENLITAGANGTRIESVLAVAAGSSTNNVISLWLDDGSSRWIYREAKVQMVTPSATVSPWSTHFIFGDWLPLVLPSGWSLMVSGTSTDVINFFCQAADL